MTLAQHRKANGLTQRQLGEKIGVSQRTIANWEGGEREPSAEKILKITEVLHLTIWEAWNTFIAHR